MSNIKGMKIISYLLSGASGWWVIISLFEFAKHYKGAGSYYETMTKSSYPGSTEVATLIGNLALKTQESTVLVTSHLKDQLLVEMMGFSLISFILSLILLTRASARHD